VCLRLGNFYVRPNLDTNKKTLQGKGKKRIECSFPEGGGKVTKEKEVQIKETRKIKKAIGETAGGFGANRQCRPESSAKAGGR